MDMRKVEAVEMPRGLDEASAPVQRSIVRNLTAIERAFGRGIPAVLGRLRGRVRRADRGGIRDGAWVADATHWSI